METNSVQSVVEIILVDHMNEIHMQLDKYQLVTKSEYFKKLFSFGKESSQDQIRINVDDAIVASDMLNLLTGNTNNNTNKDYDWLYVLKKFKCHNYFCLGNDPKELYKLTLPKNKPNNTNNMDTSDTMDATDAFTLLMEVVDEFDYEHDMKLLAMIKKNIPDNFPIESFSDDIIHRMLDTCSYHTISASYLTGLNVHDMETIEHLKNLDIPKELTITAMMVSNCNEFYAYGTQTGIVYLYQTVTYILVQKFEYKSCVTHIQFHPDNKYLVVGYSDGKIIFWNIGKNVDTMYKIIDACSYGIKSFAFFNGDKYLVVASDGNYVKVWDWINGIVVRNMNNIYLHVVSFSPRKNMVAVGESYLLGFLKIYNARNGKVVKTLRNVKNGAGVQHLCFSPNGDWLVVVYEDLSIKLLDTKKFECYKTFNGHTNTINSISLSSNGKFLLTADNKCIKIWNMILYDLHKTIYINSLDYCSLIVGPIYEDIDKKLTEYLATK